MGGESSLSSLNSTSLVTLMSIRSVRMMADTRRILPFCPPSLYPIPSPYHTCSIPISSPYQVQASIYKFCSTSRLLSYPSSSTDRPTDRPTTFLPSFSSKLPQQLTQLQTRHPFAFPHPISQPSPIYESSATALHISPLGSAHEYTRTQHPSTPHQKPLFFCKDCTAHHIKRR